jgi:hypothetical protein
MINFLKDKNKLRDVATLTTATLATLSLATTNPASAALFKLAFCGFFGGDPANGSVDGFLTIDDAFQNDASKNFGLVDAKITTTRSNTAPTNPLTYTFSDFTVSGQGLGIPTVDDFIGGESKYWRFFDAAGNNFNAVLPISVFPLSPTPPGVTIQFVDNSETRISDVVVFPIPPIRKDPEQLRIIPVPEPTSILGTAIAIGLGGMLTKKNLSKLKDDKEAA